MSNDNWIINVMNQHLPWSRSHRLGYTCLPRNKDNQPIEGMTRWLLELTAIDNELVNTHWKNSGDHNPFIVETVAYYADDIPIFRKPDYEKAKQIVLLNHPYVKPGIDPVYHRCSNGFDFIIMPRIVDCLKWYPTLDGYFLYWWWMFHELVHWATYGKDRLFWKGEFEQGELIAQLGAGILTDYCGIPNFTNKKGPYHQKWIQNMKKDIEYFSHAVEIADQAVNFLIQNLFLDSRPSEETNLILERT